MTARSHVTLSGNLFEGGEHWTMGFNMTPVTDAQAAAEAIDTLFAGDVWESATLAGFIGTETTYGGCRVVTYNAGNVRVDEGSASPGSGPIPGAAAGNSLPPQIAEVISLHTATPGGRGRGRIYFPPFSVNALATPGKLSPTSQSELVERWQTFIDDVNALEAGSRVVVYTASGEATHIVNRISVGSQFDTQRRRRNALVESYTTASIT